VAATKYALVTVRKKTGFRPKLRLNLFADSCYDSEQMADWRFQAAAAGSEQTAKLGGCLQLRLMMSLYSAQQDA